jgi:hypothetical protein
MLEDRELCCDREDAMHNSQRATPPEETADGMRAMPSTNAAKGHRRSGQVAEVAEALMPSPTDEDPPAARYGRLMMSGMSAGATAATADGPMVPLPGEPMPMEAETRVPHPAELMALHRADGYLRRRQPHRGIKLKELQAQWSSTSYSPAGRKEAGMNHPSAAYGKALMKQDNKGSTLDPVEPTNRHRNARRQGRRILTS